MDRWRDGCKDVDSLDDVYQVKIVDGLVDNR